eukprot:1242504-Heterocapsa_arctica.AAC.1
MPRSPRVPETKRRPAGSSSGTGAREATSALSDTPTGTASPTGRETFLRTAATQQGARPRILGGRRARESGRTPLP